mmetsp:Transcript_22670/g.53659  ORF Transcript_22670/g.53659 Transcript_22670/m.53659 type:complete len:475 (-) Transcript_22670:95-1519(-)
MFWRSSSLNWTRKKVGLALLDPYDESVPVEARAIALLELHARGAERLRDLEAGQNADKRRVTVARQRLSAASTRNATLDQRTRMLSTDLGGLMHRRSEQRRELIFQEGAARTARSNAARSASMAVETAAAAAAGAGVANEGPLDASPSPSASPSPNPSPSTSPSASASLFPSSVIGLEALVAAVAQLQGEVDARRQQASKLRSQIASLRSAQMMRSMRPAQTMRDIDPRKSGQRNDLLDSGAMLEAGGSVAALALKQVTATSRLVRSVRVALEACAQKQVPAALTKLAAFGKAVAAISDQTVRARAEAEALRSPGNSERTASIDNMPSLHILADMANKLAKSGALELIRSTLAPAGKPGAAEAKAMQQSLEVAAKQQDAALLETNALFELLPQMPSALAALNAADQAPPPDLNDAEVQSRLLEQGRALLALVHETRAQLAAALPPAGVIGAQAGEAHVAALFLAREQVLATVMT